jgi:hypothetical protein
MGWTKRQFLEAAYEEIGLAGYVFDLDPEQLQTAARKMDSMMASWNALGIRIGYPISSKPGNIDLAQATGVPDYANEAIYCSLSVRLAGGLGKQPSQDTRSTAHRGYAALLTRAVRPLPVQQPVTMIAGQGHRGYGHHAHVFLTPPSDPLTAGPDSQIDDIEV